LNDHNVWGAVRPALAERHTVYAIDRRGRGESGLPEEHEFQRHAEDVRAVIDAAGGEVDLLGHSYGAHCALEAALMAPERVKHLVLYEPPTPVDERGAVATLFETRDASEAVEVFFSELIGMPEVQLHAMKQTAFWPYLVSFAPTMPSEARALMGRRFDPTRYAALHMPVLFLVGSDTAGNLGEVMRQLEPHMPKTEWFVFQGHGHGAMLTAPRLFEDAVLKFLTC
jgi:pimeloyl-ACP methyl ester carboxylesterase